MADALHPVATAGTVQDGPPAPAKAAASNGSAQVYDAATGTWGNFTPPATPAPAVTSTTSTAAGRYPTNYTAPPAGTTTQSPADAAESTYLSDSTPQSDAAISANVSSLYASEIASIQQYYNGLLGQQAIVNTNESGKTRATASAEGELGQDQGNALQANQDATNSAANANIVAEEGQAEGAVTDKEASATLSAEQSQQATKLAADTQAIGYQNTKMAAAQQQIQTVAGTTDLASLPQDEYDSLYEASGFTTPEEFNAYYTASRQSAITGAKILGDTTSGVWQQQGNGTWKNVIPSQNTIGDPTTGVYSKQSDGTYKQVIAPQVKVGSIGAAGSYIYDPSSGNVQTIGPAANKIVSSGGVIYSVDPATNKATQLTANKTGWQSTTAGADNEKAAIMSYVNSLGLSTSDSAALVQSVQSNPQAYFTALGNASQAGYYIPTTVGTGDGTTQDATDAATNAAQDATDAAAGASSAGSN